MHVRSRGQRECKRCQRGGAPHADASATLASYAPDRVDDPLVKHAALSHHASEQLTVPFSRTPNSPKHNKNCSTHAAESAHLSPVDGERLWELRARCVSRIRPGSADGVVGGSECTDPPPPDTRLRAAGVWTADWDTGTGTGTDRGRAVCSIWRTVVDCRVGELVPELFVEREEGDLAALEFLPGAVRSTGSAGGRAKALASASQVPGQRRYVEAEAEDVARVERAVAHIVQLM